MLGYPKCCIDAYSQRQGFAIHYNRYALEGGKRSWRLNRFASLYDNSRLTLDYLPCSLKCYASARIASNYSSFLEKALGPNELARRISLNKMVYGIIRGQLVRFSKFSFDDQGGFVVETNDITKSATRLEVDLGSGELGIFSFDSAGTTFDHVSKATVRSTGQVWELRAQIL